MATMVNNIQQNSKVAKSALYSAWNLSHDISNRCCFVIVFVHVRTNICEDNTLFWWRTNNLPSMNKISVWIKYKSRMRGINEDISSHGPWRLFTMRSLVEIQILIDLMTIWSAKVGEYKRTREQWEESMKISGWAASECDVCFPSTMPRRASTACGITASISPQSVRTQ